MPIETQSETDNERYFATRFREDPRRDRVWAHIVAHLAANWTDAADVLDVGAGYCTFINNVTARRRVAVDMNPRIDEFAADGVETRTLSATDLASAFGPDEFDVVFSSNLLEHLTREQIDQTLAGCRRVLRPGGRLILMGPNIRLCPGAYWDDYTHVTPLSDVSLSDTVTAAGFRVVTCHARFLPFSLKSRFSHLTFLTPLYLRSPFRPFAGQMLVIAEVMR